MKHLNYIFHNYTIKTWRIPNTKLYKLRYVRLGKIFALVQTVSREFSLACISNRKHAFSILQIYPEPQQLNFFLSRNKSVNCRTNVTNTDNTSPRSTSTYIHKPQNGCSRAQDCQFYPIK